jgi:glycerophosphoryl diester phosphodiesterase
MSSGYALQAIAVAVVVLSACNNDGDDRATGASSTRVDTTTVAVANPFRTGRTLVIPHAGGDALFPQNTIYAFEHSLAMGGDVIDIDVSLSADDIPVGIHDATVDATTEGSGAVTSFTVAQLQQFDAGYDFTLDGRQPYRAKGVQIPTLRQVLERFPDTLVSIDLKNLGFDIIEPVCEVLRASHSLDRSFVGSDGDDQIIEVRKRCPDVRTSANLPDARALWAAAETNDASFQPAALIDQPPYRVGDRTLVDPDRLAFAHAHGVAILTWVIDDEATMRKLVEMGVDGIYTRYPDRLAKIVAEHDQANATP